MGEHVTKTHCKWKQGSTQLLPRKTFLESCLQVARAEHAGGGRCGTHEASIKAQVHLFCMGTFHPPAPKCPGPGLYLCC